jgi:hypothetical protein
LLKASKKLNITIINKIFNHRFTCMALMIMLSVQAVKRGLNPPLMVINLVL